MLREIHDVRQFPGEPRRRWFSDEGFDLIVWTDSDNRLLGFQLCYDKPSDQKALTWLEHEGYRHSRIDDGDNPGKMKASPVLEADGHFDREAIGRRLMENQGDVPKEIADCVYDRITQYRP
ncbi:MAG: hypothetical protein MUC98_08780 [Desulfobacterota bacterium]|jgi:hypothetical protein|nr:hypothetical protein [Thermodesulfobacteriota bacterium]